MSFGIKELFGINKLFLATHFCLSAAFCFWKRGKRTICGIIRKVTEMRLRMQRKADDKETGLMKGEHRHDKDRSL